jgi:hypothetical protein
MWDSGVGLGPVCIATGHKAASALDGRLKRVRPIFRDVKKNKAGINAGLVLSTMNGRLFGWA